jgi:Fe2+ or Zn2+ uptake regulation protein
MDVKQYEQRAIETLRGRGFRITMPRLQVVRILAESETPVTAQSVHERIIGRGDRIDLVSVYRILSTLAELHLVHHIGVVDGYVACQMHEGHGNWSKHFVCSKCGKVQELSVSSATHDLLTSNLSSLNLIPQVVKIEILGTCC